VIWGHLLYVGTWDTVNRAIYAFHMPMYFILSGFVAKPRSTSLKRKMVGLVDRLLIPSIIYIVVSLPAYFFLNRDSGYSVVQHLLTVFYVNGQIAYNDPVWFFIVLFYVMSVSEIFNIISLSFKKRCMCAAFAFVCAWLLYIIDMPIPFGFDRAVLALGFYLVGSIIKDALPKMKKDFIIAVCVLALPIYFVAGVIFNGKVSMYGFSLDNFWLFVISWLCGSMVWFGLSYCLRKVVIFRVWSQNTIFIVCTHYFGVTVVKALANFIGVSNTVIFDIGSLIVSIIALLVYMPMCRLINEKMPILNGRGKVLSKLL